jgi:hypothetical protein
LTRAHVPTNAESLFLFTAGIYNEGSVV